MIDVENVVTGSIKVALSPVPVTNRVLHPAKSAPCVLVDVLPGTAMQGKQRTAWVASVAVTTFASTRVAAKALARSCYDAVVSAPYRPGIAEGRIAYVGDAQFPDEIRTPDSPDDLYQFSATYSVTVRST